MIKKLVVVCSSAAILLASVGVVGAHAGPGSTRPAVAPADPRAIEPRTDRPFPPKSCSGVSAVVICVGGARPNPQSDCHRVANLVAGVSLWRCLLEVCEGVGNTYVCILGGTEPCPPGFRIGNLVVIYRCTRAVESEGHATVRNRRVALRQR